MEGAKLTKNSHGFSRFHGMGVSNIIHDGASKRPTMETYNVLITNTFLSSRFRTIDDYSSQFRVTSQPCSDKFIWPLSEITKII